MNLRPPLVPFCALKRTKAPYRERTVEELRTVRKANKNGDFVGVLMEAPVRIELTNEGFADLFLDACNLLIRLTYTCSRSAFRPPLVHLCALSGGTHGAN